MNWQEVIEHPALQDLPFKIELNERGQILMTPVKVRHSAFQGKIGQLLSMLLSGGMILPECAIATRKGTKVADVAWASAELFQQIQFEVEASIAPEICIEVTSASNTDDEMQEKKELYFESGAKEVWICTNSGAVSFYSPTGQLTHSLLTPQFPATVTL
ncbi:MAG: Uma2 family endonuclease [Caldilineaceae bacterium]